MIRDNSVYDIFSLLYGILIKNPNGKYILYSFFIAQPSVISYVTICYRILKTEGVSLKFLHTVNLDFLVSELMEEQFSHIKSKTIP